MSKQDIERVVKTAVERTIKSQKKLTGDEKVLCVAAVAVFAASIASIHAITAIYSGSKIRALQRKVKGCEEKIAELEQHVNLPAENK